MHDVAEDQVRAWTGLVLEEPLPGGHRNTVWRATIGPTPVVVRRSRRSSESLAWELDLLAGLDRAGFVVPTVVAADDGRRSVDGVVAQRWLPGHPPGSESEWRAVASELSRLHNHAAQHPQRPGCATVRELASLRRSVDADLDAMPPEVAELVIDVFCEFGDVPTGLIHGDPDAGNIRIGPDGSVGLLDWDESRVDLIWHDLSNLGVQVLGDADHDRARRLSDAWEAANGWVVEPDYARRRLDALTGH